MGWFANRRARAAREAEAEGSRVFADLLAKRRGGVPTSSRPLRAVPRRRSATMCTA